MTDLISFNGNITAAKEATVPALDRGFLFGDSVFETMVCFSSQILNITEHLKRLRFSSEKIGLTVPWSDQELTFELQAMADQISDPKASLKLMITRGNGQGLDTSAAMIPNKIIFAGKAPEHQKSIYEEGISLMSSVLPYTERGPLPKIGNYLRSIVALQDAKLQKFDDLMWVNSTEEITESSTANIFFLGRTGDLLEVATPPPESGILMGLTRQRVIELLEKSKIPVTVRTIYHDEIPRFDEAFVCSSVRGLVPVNKIDQHRLYTTRPKAVFQLFSRLYDTWVETQLGKRVDWNTGLEVKDF